MKIEGNIKKFNQFTYPVPTILVTCNDENKKTNIITLAWHTTFSKKPPLYAISVASSHYSHDLIQETKEFVVNFISYDLVEKAYFCGHNSGRNTDKIQSTKLTLIPSKKIEVPLIKEGYAHLECKLSKSFTAGDHTAFIGKVITAQIDKHAFKQETLNTTCIQPLFYMGNDNFTTIDRHKTKKIN